MDNNYDLTANLNYILNNKIDNNDNIILQDKILKSDDFNKTYKYIEESLNLLYEKTRVLQDIIDYTKTFLDSEITNSISDCKTLLNSIEDDKNLLKNKTYINYSVPFYFGLNNSTDRNDTVLSDTVIYNDKMMNNYDILSDNKINYFTVSRKQNSLYNNSSNYISSKQYRSLYMFKEIQSSPIEETLIFSFNTPVNINSIKPVLSNCYLSAIKLTLDTDNIIDLDINSIDLFETKTVKNIEITIQSTNYSISQTIYDNITNNNFSAIINNINTDTNSNLTANKYYYYLFGIDDIKFLNIKQKENCSFYSQDIYIGELTKNEYLTLYVDDSVDECSIEYYIVNGTETIPILPENKESVVDEKIFYKYPTRFSIDNNKEVIIKKNGQIVNTSLYEAINTNDNNLWTVSYTPIRNNIDNLYNETIKVKVIIRNYNAKKNTYIKNIKVRKYGGNNLWIA
jgi:hypothetical protein